MDAIALLKRDHSIVKKLFDRYEELSAEAHARKKHVVVQISRELSIHTSIEERYLYPYAKARAVELAPLVAEALEEHSVAKWELASLARRDPEDERFDAKVSVMIDVMRWHIEEEETEFFPCLREYCTRAELDALGDALAAAKAAAPTHPHPRLPDEPPGLTVALPLAAAFDRTRDLANFAFGRWQKVVDHTIEGTVLESGRVARKTIKTTPAAAKRAVKRSK